MGNLTEKEGYSTSSKGSINSAEVVTMNQASESAKKIHDTRILSVSRGCLQTQPLLEIIRNIWHKF